MPTFGDMVYHLGGVPAAAGLPLILGNVYFVSSVTGSSGNDGTRDKPYLTVAQAIVNSTLNDCIIVMPGHTETISSTVAGGSSLCFHVDSSHVNLTIWGVGNYDYMPTFTQTAKIELKGANCHLYNLKFVSGSTNLDQAMQITAKGVKVEGCRFEEVAASTYCYDECLITGATANDAEGLHIANCLFYQDSAESSGGIIVPINQNNVKITNNRFYGTWTTGGGPIVLSSTVAVIGLEITHNLISNTQSSATKSGITVLSDAAQGIVAYNCLVTAGSSAQNLGTGIQVSASGTIGVFENYVTGRPGESGRLDPAVFSTA